MGNLQLAFIQNLGVQELILIFFIVLLLFGAKRMPELFRSFGKSIKEFKKATSDIEDDIRTAIDTEDEPKNKSKAKSDPEKPSTVEKSEKSEDSEKTKSQN